MTRGGRHKDRDEAERRCIATGEVQPKNGMIRFVVAPDGTLVPDVLEKLPGRGIWVSCERSALEKALKKGLFSRAGKASLRISPDLPDEVEHQLARRLVGLISLARKSGRAVAGFEKVKSWLASGEAKVLLQAFDGSQRGKNKLRTPEGGRFLGMLSAAELGFAFGRESVIHGALAAGGLTTRVVEEATRLSGLRVIHSGNAAEKDKTTI
ncbi:MAG: RNA-binding protein [Paracoccaceae bacterium]